LETHSLIVSWTDEGIFTYYILEVTGGTVGYQIDS
jgi:hypothetical protein